MIFVIYCFLATLNLVPKVLSPWLILNYFSWNDNHLATKKLRQKSLLLGNIISRTSIKHLEKLGRRWAVEHQRSAYFKRCQEDVDDRILMLTQMADNVPSLDNVQTLYKYLQNNLVLKQNGNLIFLRLIIKLILFSFGSKCYAVFRS